MSTHDRWSHPDAVMSPTDKPSALVQGTLDMLILKTLALEPMHGYGC